MTCDWRQVLAGFLTISMFVMLVNMVIRDFDAFLGETPSILDADHNLVNISHSAMVKRSLGPWTEHDEVLKACWKKSSLDEIRRSTGYIFFSLSISPEFHAAEVANAVLVAKHLGATLVLPEIRGIKPGETRYFGDIYDVNKFIASLDGVVRVAVDVPIEASSGKLIVVKVPERVSKDFIASNVAAVFRSKKNLRVESYFNQSNMSKTKTNEYFSPYECLAMFESLKLQADLLKVADSMVGTLRSLSQKMHGRFIAVDFKVELLGKRICRGKATTNKWCHNAEEIGVFLKKIGFERETSIYLTQHRWHNSLSGLRSSFPNTFTKDAVMPMDRKAKFLDSRSHIITKVIDFYICTQSDVFISAFPNRFYAAVVGNRIALGKTHVLVLTNKNSSSAPDYASRYISQRSHLAYSCFC